MNQRQAVSRVEVVIILLVTFLVAGLIVAGIGRLREAAERMNCTNRLKQLGLSMQIYLDVQERLPALTDQGNGAPTGRGLPSVFVSLMPFLESTPVVFRPKRPVDYYHGHSSVVVTYKDNEGNLIFENGGMANYPLRLFLDPADKTANELRDVSIQLPDGTIGYYATGSYAVNGLLPWGIPPFGGLSRGDLANTILFGERPQVCRTASGETVYNLWGLGIYSPHMPAFAALMPDNPTGLAPTGQAAPVLPLPDEGSPDRDALIRVRVGRCDAPSEIPDFSTPMQIILRDRPCDPRLPGSPHRGGMQVAMGDGSVRVFAPDTSPWVFWNACVPPGPPADP
jgi:prepilin-type processing-associated H-X9-DG protein